MKVIRLLYAANVIHHSDGVLRQNLNFRLLVENRSFAKRVEVHWAGEDGHWHILPAAFLNRVSAQVEIWHARGEIIVAAAPDSYLPGDVTFAVRVCIAGRDDWDNNEGRNYRIGADSGLRLADGIALLHTDYQPSLQAGQKFLPITVAAHSPTPHHVYVRWSIDGWRTSTDTSCYFWRKHWHGAMGSAARNPNRYGTQIWISHLDISSAFRVEYAVAGEMHARTLWDNNFGQNYLVRHAPLRVLTLNLHCNQEENQDAKLSLIAQVIRELDIDIVCFQEVAEPWNDGHGDPRLNSANLIRERIGRPYHVYCDWSHVGFGRYRESCAILSRFEFVRTDSTYISPGRNPNDIHSRRAVMAQVHVPYMGAVNVFSVHLSWWDAGFREQFTRLRQWIAAQQSDHIAATLVGGDFNTSAQSEGYALATESSDLVDQFAVASPRSVYSHNGGPAGWPGPPPANPNRIDFIFLRRGDRLAPVAARELFTDTAYGRVSDHSGYMVEFEPR